MVSRKENQFATIFPKKWSCSRVSRYHIENQVFDFNQGSKLVTKSRLNSRFRTLKKFNYGGDLMTFIESEAD